MHILRKCNLSHFIYSPTVTTVKNKSDTGFSNSDWIDFLMNRYLSKASRKNTISTQFNDNHHQALLIDQHLFLQILRCVFSVWKFLLWDKRVKIWKYHLCFSSFLESKFEWFITQTCLLPGQEANTKTKVCMCKQCKDICVTLPIQPESLPHLIYLLWGYRERYKLKVKIYNLGTYPHLFGTNLYQSNKPQVEKFHEENTECWVTKIGNGQYLPELDLDNLQRTIHIFSQHVKELIQSRKEHYIGRDWRQFLPTEDIDTLGSFCLCIWLFVCQGGTKYLLANLISEPPQLFPVLKKPVLCVRIFWLIREKIEWERTPLLSSELGGNSLPVIHWSKHAILISPLAQRSMMLPVSLFCL